VIAPLKKHHKSLTYNIQGLAPKSNSKKELMIGDAKLMKLPDLANKKATRRVAFFRS